MSTGWVAFLVIACLVLAGLVQAKRGLFEEYRQYDGWDVFGALVEIPLLIWGVYYLYHT